MLGGVLLAQFAPHPLVTPCIVAAATVLATLSCTALMPESLRARTALNLRIRPRIPAQIRGPFWFAAVSTAATWSVLGLYLSLAPGLADQAVGSHNFAGGRPNRPAGRPVAGLARHLRLPRIVTPARCLPNVPGAPPVPSEVRASRQTRLDGASQLDDYVAGWERGT